MPNDNEPLYLVPQSLLFGLVTLAQHALDLETALQAAQSADAADKQTITDLNSKLTADDTSVSQLQSQLSTIQSQEQGVPLPDDVQTKINGLLTAPDPTTNASTTGTLTVTPVAAATEPPPEAEKPPASTPTKLEVTGAQTGDGSAAAEPVQQ